MLALAGVILGALSWAVAFIFGVQWGLLCMTGAVMIFASHACELLGEIKGRLAPTAAASEARDEGINKRQAVVAGGAVVVIVGAALLLALR